jgi:signal transduction histidine kinase
MEAEHMESPAVREERTHAPEAGARGAHEDLPDGAALIADGLLAYIERSAAAVAIVDGGSLMIRYANPAFDRLVQPQSDRRTAPELSGALPSGAAASILGMIRTMPTGHASPCQGEVASGRSGPGIVDWAVTISSTPHRDGRRPDLVLEIRDITRERGEQRELTELLERLREVNGRLLDSSLREADLADRARAAGDAKSTFLATMSHELRTPLTAILGYEELLADGLFGPVSDVQLRHLSRIKLSAKHLLALIDQILSLARVETGRETMALEDVAVAELVDWTSTIVEPLARAKGLAFVARDATPGNPGASTVRLRTDATKVRQVLVNLLGNAVKFTDRGSVDLTVRCDDGEVIFTIRDTGIGIAPADLDRVFDTFWQVEQRQSRMAGGSGLGLSVSRRLARLLGGDVTVESVPGAGSTFILGLPVAGPAH